MRDFKHRQRQQQRKRRQQCRERDWEDKAVRSHRHRKLSAVNKQRENGKFYTSCEKSFFFTFVSSLEGGQESPFRADD